MEGVALMDSCQHSLPSLASVTVYNFVLSAAFVASLYQLVPSQVRKRDRDDSLQIKWRCFASLVISVGAAFSYSYLFCDENAIGRSWSTIRLYFVDIRSIIGVLTHCGVLYFGSTVTAIARIYVHQQQWAKRHPKEAGGNFIKQVALVVIVEPIKRCISRDSEIWKSCRNFVIAPICEEVVFRGCMVPALLTATQSTLITCLVAPVFFGIAHVHHGIIQARQGVPVKKVLFMTLFQFAYTTLFGWYVAYAFIRTGNVPSIIASHAFCNWMGLPDLSFLNPHSGLYRYRIQLLSAYVAGVCFFVYLFYSDAVLPDPSRLRIMLGLTTTTALEKYQ